MRSFVETSWWQCDYQILQLGVLGGAAELFKPAAVVVPTEEAKVVLEGMLRDQNVESKKQSFNPTEVVCVQPIMLQATLQCFTPSSRGTAPCHQHGNVWTRRGAMCTRTFDDTAAECDHDI